MGQWLHNTLTPRDSAQSPDHAELEELARLVDGTLASAERKRLIRHLNSCGQCYEILQETLKDVSAETSGQPSPAAWWKTKPVLALAASLLMILVIGGQLVYKYRAQHAYVITAALDLDQGIKDILLEDHNLEWRNRQRVERLVSAIKQRGFQIKPFDRVVLAAPYYQTKSMFGPKEILEIRIEDKVAYLEVKKLP